MRRSPLLTLSVVLLGAGPANCGGRVDQADPPPSQPTSAVTPNPAAPPPTRLLATQQSRYTEPVEVVIRDAAAWRSAWTTMNRAVIEPSSPPPAVDFGRDMVLVVAAGQKPTGGFAIRVDSVTAAAGGGLRVDVTEERPGPSCMLTQALTSPAEAVSVPRAEGAVTFRRRVVERAC